MKGRRAWLIWLVSLCLLVFGGVYFFQGLIFYSHTGHGPDMRERTVMVGFVNSIKSFQTEYNQWPVDDLAKNDESKLMRTRGSVLQTLFAKNEKNNPNKIVFFEPPIAKDQKRGLYYTDKDEPVLTDAWGEPYYFVIDLNNDDKVPNPDPRPNEPRELPTTVIVFSSGPDRDPNTWKDNVTSWR